MKYIALTFDDGRSDNYMIAKRIMDKYQFSGTVYITTGFIDGTWKENDILQSPTRPLTVEEIKSLHQSGWEIGMHGDKHKTQVDDMRVALNKLQSWGINNSCWGISVPNSVVEEVEVSRMLNSEYGNTIAYIRRGRKCDTTKMSNKVLYLLYSILTSKWAYRIFNAPNIYTYGKVDKMNIPSIVVKSNDKPEMIMDFIKYVPDKSVVVLMFHSILETGHARNCKDPWSWGEDQFEALCERMAELQKKGMLNCVPLMDFMKSREDEGEKS